MLSIYVVMESIATKARDVVLRKSRLFRYSNLHYDGITTDIPNSYKYSIVLINKPNRQ